MTPPEPARLGDYALLEKLGQGGMALVYRAERVGEAGFKKTVAIKRMLPEYRRNPALLERFAAEARTNARLDHPNLVHVLDFGIDPEPYLVLEFVQGVTLAALLQRLVQKREQLELAAACFIGAEAAQGLDHAHRKRDEQGMALGIVHRDVSPQNCLLSSEGAVKVSDFGLVKAADNVVQTGSGVPIGKMSYMAPEQAGEAPIDARADVFSLGIVIWEMLAMRPLMPSNDPARASAMLAACEFERPSRFNPKVPPALDAIVMRCLAKDPGERTPSAQALSMQLLEVLHDIAPGYGRDQLARLLGWSFPEKGWVIDEPHETAAQPSIEQRMSMPQIPAAEMMQRASAAAESANASAHAPAAHNLPATPPGAHALQPNPQAVRKALSFLPWIVALVVGGILLLTVVIVLGIVAYLSFSPGPEEKVEPLESVTLPAVPGLILRVDVPGARVFAGDRDLGPSPVRITAEQLDGPLVAIAAGHEPTLLTPELLSRALDRGDPHHDVALLPSAAPSRVVFVRHPRPALARLAFSSTPLGPVPGLLLVPSPGDPSPGDAPEIEIVEPGQPTLRFPLASCPPHSVCVLAAP